MKVLFDFRDKCTIINNNCEFEYCRPKDLSLIFPVLPNEIYVITGPGSYTGIRKALSIANAITDNVYGICILRDFISANNGFYVEKDKIVYILSENNIKIISIDEFKNTYSDKPMIGNLKAPNWEIINCATNEIYSKLSNFKKKLAEQNYSDKFIW